MSKSNNSVANTLESVFDDGEYVMDFPLASIVINPQVRRKRNLAKIKEISESIEQHGQLEPIVIGFPDDEGLCPLYYGHTRYYAQQERGSITIKAIQREKPPAIRVTQFAENLHREDLTIVDIAIGINDLKEQDGLKAKEICEQLRMSNSQVSKYSSIGSMPTELLDRAEKISNDIDTFYYLSNIYKRSPADAEQVISEGEKAGELNRVTVRSVSDKLKNAGNTDENEQDLPPQEPKGKGKGKDKKEPGENSDSDREPLDEGENQAGDNINAGGDSPERKAPGAASNKTDVFKATLIVSFIDTNNETVEGVLINSTDDKPSEDNCALVLVDGYRNEIPLEELKLVRISY